MTLLPAVVILVARDADRARAADRVHATSRSRTSAVPGTWIAILLLAHAGAIGDPAAIAPGSGLQAAIALAALVGMGTKAGVMPLHVWLPRAHPIAPAPVSALMSGVMIKVALYALVRVLVEWVGVLPVWFGVLVLARRRALGGRRRRLRALPARPEAAARAALDRERRDHRARDRRLPRPARARRRRRGRRSRSARRCCTRVNHAVFKALLFLGAGAFERAVGSLELDRLGGLLRRMPWTGGAFLVGAMAIAGLPPLNGFASEWLTLQALLHVPAYGHVGDGIAGAIALGALAATAALARLLLRQGRRARAARPAAARGRGRREEAPLPMRGARRLPRARLRRPRRRAGPALRRARRARALGRRRRRRSVGLHLPGTGSLPTVGIALALVALTAALVLLRGRRSAAPAPTWACGQLVEPRAELDERRLHEAAAPRARGGAAPAARDRRAHARAASCRRSPTAATCRT